MIKRKLRSVDVHFWEDIYIEMLNPHEKLLFLYLLTCPDCNLAGIYEISIRKIEFQTGLDKDTIIRIFNRFESDSKIYYKYNYVIISNFTKRQNYNPKMLSNVKSILIELPENIHCFIKSLNNKHLKNIFDKLSIPYHSLSIPILESESENECENEVESECKKYLTPETSYFEKIKNLFASYTRIRDPNIKTHVKPVLKFFDAIPQQMTVRDIEICIETTFAQLDSKKGVKMDFLLSNIQRRITAKHEEILKRLKKKNLKEADALRKNTANIDYEFERAIELELLKDYRTFLECNSDKFSFSDRKRLLNLLKENKVLEVGYIIEPIMNNS